MKLADIIHDGLGPLHTATTRKKRKAHEAADELKNRLTTVENQILSIKVQLGRHDAFAEAFADDSASPLARETIEAIRDVITKGR